MRLLLPREPLTVTTTHCAWASGQGTIVKSTRMRRNQRDSRNKMPPVRMHNAQNRAWRCSGHR
jgi:hypothetical protein